MKADVASFSVWMVPDEPDLTDLHTWIKTFGDTNSTPVFLPHMTLMGDLAGGEAELSECVRSIATGFSSHTVTVTGVGIQDLFFKSLYLELSQPAQLVREQAALAQGLPSSQVPGAFQPHISMAYGPIAAETKADGAKALGRFQGKSLRFRQLHLVRSSQTVPIEEWKILKTFDLG